MSSSSLIEAFGNRVRVRACGLLYNDGKLLLVKHRFKDYDLWSPPGGGVEFGESIEEALKREFLEETGINIQVKRFLFIKEHLAPPLHAIEVYYEVITNDYSYALGLEPEVVDHKILIDIDFVGESDLERIEIKERHSILKSCTNPIELLDKQGHLK